MDCSDSILLTRYLKSWTILRTNQSIFIKIRPSLREYRIFHSSPNWNCLSDYNTFKFSLAWNWLIPITMILPQPCCFTRQVSLLRNVFIASPWMGYWHILKGVQSCHELSTRPTAGVEERAEVRFSLYTYTPALVDFVLVKPSDKHARALNELEKSTRQINCSKECKNKTGTTRSTENRITNSIKKASSNSIKNTCSPFSRFPY